MLRDRVEVTAFLSNGLRDVAFGRGVTEPARTAVSVESVEGAGGGVSDYKNFSSVKTVREMHRTHTMAGV